MATLEGESGKNSSGSYFIAELTYSVSNNVVTFTKLRVRKQPDNLTVATSGKWDFSIRCGWNNIVVSGSPQKDVYGNKWTTLWSGSESCEIEEDTTIYFVAVAPRSGTTLSGLSITAEKDVNYEESTKTHYVVVYHEYVDGGQVASFKTYEYDDGTYISSIEDEFAIVSDDYIYQYAKNQSGKKITSLTVTDSMSITLYYEPANKWFETYHSSTGSTNTQLFNFSEYEVHCWRFITSSPGTLEFSAEGDADTIGWITSERDLSVNDNGYPTNGSYIVSDDDSGDSNNFKIIYDIEEEDEVTLYLYVSIYKGESASNVQINVSYERLTRNVQIDYYVLSGTSSNIMFSKFPPNIYYGDILYPADYITPDDLDAGCTFEYAVIRGETIYANDISSYSYEINDDERWNFYYSRLRWTWEGANRTTADAASAEETIQAYEAITGNGMTSAFNHKVWNDLCAVTLEALNSKNYTWDSKYASYANTTMSTSPYTLTALRFNSLRKNIDKLCSTGISEKTKYNGILLDSNKVIGSEFITLTDCLNSA